MTGKKERLIGFLLAPEEHRKKTPKTTQKRAKPKKTIKKRSYHAYDLAFGHRFGFDDDEDDDESEDDSSFFCGYGGRDHCDGCGRKDHIDPHNGLCTECAEDMRPVGGCPCWRQTCRYLDELDGFECEA